MSQDYTHAHADRLRAMTVAGELANLIREINRPPELITVAAPVTGVAMPPCGLTLTVESTPSAYCGSTQSNGNAHGSVNVCSVIGQTVTVTATITSTYGCQTKPTVEVYFANNIGSSTYTFTAGACELLNVSVSYGGCPVISVSDNGKVIGTITITFTTSNGCVTTLNMNLQCATWLLAWQGFGVGSTGPPWYQDWFVNFYNPSQTCDTTPGGICDCSQPGGPPPEYCLVAEGPLDSGVDEEIHLFGTLPSDCTSITVTASGVYYISATTVPLPFNPGGSFNFTISSPNWIAVLFSAPSASYTEGSGAAVQLTPIGAGMSVTATPNCTGTPKANPQTAAFSYVYYVCECG